MLGLASPRDRLLLSAALLLVPTVASVASCAAGTSYSGLGGGASTTTGTQTTGSGAASTSTAGTTSAGGAGGSGGTGTTSSTTTSTSTTSSSTSTTSSSTGSGGSGGGDVDAGADAGDGGTTTIALAMLASSGTQVLAGVFQPGSGWTTTPLAGASNHTPAITFTGAATGVGLIRSATTGEVRSTTFSGAAFTPFVPIAANVTTQSAPSITASGAVASAVYHGDDFKHYFASYLASWAPTAEPVTSGTQSFGPSAAAITAIGTNTVIAYAGNNHDLYDQTRAGGAWQPAHGHGLGDAVMLTPAIVALTAGPDLMIAFVRTTDARIVTTTHSGSTWSAPQPIDTNALSNDPVSLAALPGGGAVLAYRGQNGKTYWSRYTPGNTPPWSVPTGITAANFDTPSPPAVAKGTSGVDAEMVFIDAAGGAAMHARLTGNTWSTPATIGGASLTRAAIAAMP